MSTYAILTWLLVAWAIFGVVTTVEMLRYRALYRDSYESALADRAKRRAIEDAPPCGPAGESASPIEEDRA